MRFERALTASMASHFGEVATRREREPRRIVFTEYVITESVCPPGVPRYCAASRAQLFGIYDSSRRESKQLHGEVRMSSV